MWSRAGMKDRTAHGNQEFLPAISLFCFSWHTWADLATPDGHRSSKPARKEERCEETASRPY